MEKRVASCKAFGYIDNMSTPHNLPCSNVFQSVALLDTRVAIAIASSRKIVCDVVYFLLLSTRLTSFLLNWVYA